MNAAAKTVLAIAAVAAVAVVASSGGDEAPSSGSTAELVTGTYGQRTWSIRRHGSQGFAYAVDGKEVSAAATLRDAFDDVLEYLGPGANASDVVRFALVDRARSVVVQQNVGLWDWTAYRGALVDAEGTGLTRGAALIAALESLDEVLDEM